MLKIHKINNVKKQISEINFCQKIENNSNSYFVKLWSEDVNKQYQLSIQDKKEDENLSIQVHFDIGETYQNIFLKKNNTTFELHEFLRKNINTKIEKNEILVNLKKLNKLNQRLVLEAFLCLVYLNQWNYSRISSQKKNENKIQLKQIYIHSDFKDSELIKINLNAFYLTTSTNSVRELATKPTNFLRPEHFIKLIQTNSKENKYLYKFYDYNQLKKMKAGAFEAVVRADQNTHSGIVELTYNPSKSNSKCLALVGKGLCFDTGGYNIKTGSHMYSMHRDMTGAAVAFATFTLLVKMKFPYKLKSYLAIAENLVSETAFKPNEVVEALNGKTIEIVDTDAEGRLVLSDTLALCSKESPKLIMDFATLTGAAVRSLDTRRSAVFSNRTKYLNQLQEVGDECGERVWGFPFGEDYKEYLKSDFADIKQCSIKTNADHIYAATFLNEFVNPNSDWVHLDLSSEENSGGLGLVSTSETGFGVRFAYNFIKKYYNLK